MPELPEVETIARGLDKRVRGDGIESVWLGSKPEPLKSSAEDIIAALESKTISGVRRVGKHIVFDLASSNGSPSSCFSSMKSKRTITWLTITPIKLATPKNAMNPNGVPMIHSAATAPTMP